MTRFAVVLQTAEGMWSGRDGLRIVDADTPQEALKKAHPAPPDQRIVQAWIHPLAGRATTVEVVVEAPKWGRSREVAS